MSFYSMIEAAPGGLLMGLIMELRIATAANLMRHIIFGISSPSNHVFQSYRPKYLFETFLSGSSGVPILETILTL